MKTREEEWEQGKNNLDKIGNTEIKKRTDAGENLASVLFTTGIEVDLSVVGAVVIG